jgi:CheY-like chemotaxis protein
MESLAKKVLVIEDSRFVREALRLTLVKQGYEVVTAADGNEGWTSAITAQPDIIVMDWLVPGVNGSALMQKFQEDNRTCNIPVFVVSARAKECEMDTTSSNKISGFIQKDSVVLAQLVQTLSQLSALPN